jgi:integrase
VAKPKVRSNGEGSVFFNANKQLWVATVSHEGKVKQFAAKLERDAKHKRTEWLRLRQQGVRPTSDRWLLNDWLDHWLLTQKTVRDAKGQRLRGVEETTWSRYEILVRRHIQPYFKGVLLGKLTAELVDVWQGKLHAAGVSVGNQHAALQRLSTALDAAVARRHVAYNVATAKQVARPRVPKPKHVQPSETDLQRLLGAIRGDPFEALVFMALGGGMRRAEVVGLRWEDVERSDDDNAVIVVRRRVNYLGKGIGRLERDGLKNGGEQRRVHIGPLVYGILRERWQHQLADRRAAGAHWRGLDNLPAAPSGFIFTNPTSGTPLNPRGADKVFARIRDATGLDQRRLHALRRVFTTLLDRGGVSTRVVQELAGHKVVQMTEYYQQPMESQKSAAATALDEQLRALRGGLKPGSPVHQ